MYHPGRRCKDRLWYEHQVQTVLTFLSGVVRVVVSIAGVSQEQVSRAMVYFSPHYISIILCFIVLIWSGGRVCGHHSSAAENPRGDGGLHRQDQDHPGHGQEANRECEEPSRLVAVAGFAAPSLVNIEGGVGCEVYGRTTTCIPDSVPWYCDCVTFFVLAAPFTFQPSSSREVMPVRPFG